MSRICHLNNAFAINGYLICVISIVNQGQNMYIACANIIISRYARHARANWIMKIIANTLIFLITMFWRKCYAFVQVHLRCAKHYLYSFYTITNKYIGRYIGINRKIFWKNTEILICRNESLFNGEKNLTPQVFST